MSDALNLRRLNAGDYGALVELWTAAGLPYKPHGRDSRSAFEHQLTLPQIAFFGLFDHDRIIGTSLVTHDGRKGWINRVAVHPDYRRRGLAIRLIRESEQWLVSCGIGIFACLIEGYNDTSRATFKAAGYELFEGVTYFTRRVDPDV